MYPYVSLREISIDPELARRLPRRLAYYHLAIPIAKDDDYLTVALAFSDNKAIIPLLKQALNSPVTIVRADEAEIKDALDQIWQQPEPLDHQAAPTRHIIGWGETDAMNAWVETFMREVSQGLRAASTLLPQAPDNPRAALLQTNAVDADLIVTTQSSTKGFSQIKPLLTPEFPSVLILRASPPPIRKMLCIMRGHSPDRSVLRWAVALAKYYDATVQLLAGVPETALGQGMAQYASLLNKDTPGGAHLFACRQTLHAARVKGRVHIRQGALEMSIAEEVGEGSYDLIIMAVEAYGEFVYRAVETLEGRYPGHRLAMLLVKP